MKLLWFIPTHGDSRYLGSAQGARAAGFDYFRQVAIAADSLGYEGVLIPTGRSCEDPWVVAASLIEATRRLKFLVALRPGLVAPSLAARMAASFDRLSGGRLMINLVTGGDADELAGDGQFLDHAERYAQSEEFMRIWRAVLERSHGRADDPAGVVRGVDFEGRHLSVRDARLLYPPLQRPYPPLYFGGSSPAAGPVAADHCDVYLTWGEPPQAVAEKLSWIRSLVAERKRQMRFGIRLHVITRDTSEEAWAAAEALLADADEEVVAAAQRTLAGEQSVGQQRMVALHGGRRDSLEVYPNLWAGPGLLRGGAGTALVGSHAEVADRIAEYRLAGYDEFILSGWPHDEEAVHFGAGVVPELRARGLLPATGTATGPAPEAVAAR